MRDFLEDFKNKIRRRSVQLRAWKSHQNDRDRRERLRRNSREPRGRRTHTQEDARSRSMGWICTRGSESSFVIWICSSTSERRTRHSTAVKKGKALRPPRACFFRGTLKFPRGLFWKEDALANALVIFEVAISMLQVAGIVFFSERAVAC